MTVSTDPSTIRIQATCHLSYAFEVGQGIDLEASERSLVSTARQTVRSRRRVPQHFEYRPAPLRVSQDPTASSPPGVRCLRSEIVLYDFGAASANFAFGFEGPLTDLVAVSVALQSGTSGLLPEARQRVEQLIGSLGPAVSRPAISSEVEDYLVFEIVPHQGDLSAAGLLAAAAPTLARVLRAAPGPLADEEVTDAFEMRLRYGPDDLTLIDWNAAIIVDPEPEETRVVLEFANVQLLEFRHLDGQLDEAVDRAYEAVAKAERGLLRRFRPPVQTFRQLALHQIDSAILFERVSNALKLVGDQFLSRVYQVVSTRFHFGDWDRGIARKLEVLDGIYQKLGDQVSARRLEFLEWIVIGLIALEILLR